MRRKVLEGNYYIPHKLIKSLSSNLPSNLSTIESGEKRYEARIEKEVVVRRLRQHSCQGCGYLATTRKDHLHH